MIKCKIISSLDKALPNGNFDDYSESRHLTVLRGERASFQLIYELDCSITPVYSKLLSVTLSGNLSKYTTLHNVMSVPATANARCSTDEDYIVTSPALIPDVLTPLYFRGKLMAVPGALCCAWIDVEVPEDSFIPNGELTLTLTYTPSNPSDPSFSADLSLTVETLDAALPEQSLIFTQWFHHDCLADYYKMEKWSEEHFRIIESFVRCAKRAGINMLYTPLITPPLDNEYDTRDLQLADVTVTDGEYAFGWEKLDRWIDILDRVGIKYLEVGHLFTQGGAKHATKVTGNIGGERKRLFPADTPCDDPEYARFLRALLTSFISHMKERGDGERMIFHISDEPPRSLIETYKRAKGTVEDILEEYEIFDALSDYGFYEQGVVKRPIVILNALHKFVGRTEGGLWTYNCCGPSSGYSNRLMAMTLSRNRSISLLLYKFNIEGFLHWGFNFYNTAGSSDLVNPFLDTSAGGRFPSGDAFSVYPGENGEPLESLRLVSFKQGLDDLSAYKLCESLYSKDEVIAALEEELGEEIKTTTYINDSEKMLRVRDRINLMIKARL